MFDIYLYDVIPTVPAWFDGSAISSSTSTEQPPDIQLRVVDDYDDALTVEVVEGSISRTDRSGLTHAYAGPTVTAGPAGASHRGKRRPKLAGASHGRPLLDERCDVGAAGGSPANQSTAAQSSRWRRFIVCSGVAATSASRTQVSRSFQRVARLSSERSVTDRKSASNV